MFRSFLTVLFCLFSMSASAQEQSRAILVLDASGSMWGQIDGVAKITIAQEVIGELLNTLPETQLLGLTAYGHRRKGDCNDIETLLAPGTDRAAIASAVNAIKPKGKTPLSAAVIQAAEALKYTEEAATVILVSDGRETCEFDPCEVGRRLEEAGIDFTAHVIGFDVSDPAERAQLQCLAEETGGTFRTADNAAELSRALEVVAAPPEPEPVTVTFRAIEGENGPDITEDLIWTLGTDAAGLIYENQAAGGLREQMMQGSGRVEVLRTSDEASAEAMFTVGENDMIVTLVLPDFVPPATLDAPESAPAGSLVAVRWSGPNAQNDHVTTADLDMGDSSYHHYTYLRDGDNDVVLVRMPPEPGDYEIRYMLNDGNKVLARRSITATPLTIILNAPAQAAVGSTVQLDWSGPDYQNDFISVASSDQGDSSYINYTYTRDGNPLPLQMPPEPGIYEIRYVMNAKNHVPARTTIEVVDIVTSISGPASAPAGATIQVAWEGGDYRNDYVSVAVIGSRDNQYEGYTYTREGNPLPLTMPLEPGDYELRYVLAQDNTVLARSPISIAALSAALDAPDTAPAAGRIMVGWTGPGYKNDFVSVAEIGARANQYEAYTYTRDGTPLSLQMPTKPGEYELRYVASGSPAEILARRPITVEAVGATLQADAEAPAAGQLVVTWTGPDNKNDFVSVAEDGMRPNQYEAYTYTRDGSPLKLQMPTKPGVYELRYVVQGTDQDILVRQPITVVPVTATLDSPANAAAGDQIAVGWQGPAYRNDYISVAKPGAKPQQYETYTYVRDGNPLRLQVPADPGSYELRYIVDGTDHAVLATRTLTVDPVSAMIEAADSAAPGSNLVVTWQGPDYKGDYLAISRIGDKGYETYTYTRDGSPTILKVPDQPGSYELRYVLDQGRTVILRKPLTVE